MFLISLLVVVPIVYVLSGRDLPVIVVELLDEYVPGDKAPSEDLVAWASLAGAAVGATPLHKLVRYLATVVHELGHAFTAGLLGGRPKQITISTDTSGMAMYEPPIHWDRFRASIVSAAGYPAPAIASLAAMQAIQAGHSKAWFLFSGGTLAVAIIALIRNFWGLFWTAGAVAGSYFAARELPTELLGGIIAAIAGFLAVEAFRHAFTQYSLTRVLGTHCDAEKISMFLRLPLRTTAFLHLAATTAIGAYAVRQGVEPHWSEIRSTVEDLVRTR
jgi:hypothetical protein